MNRRSTGPHPPAGHTQVEVHSEGAARRQDDLVADEVPVAMVYNGISHAVMMATPGRPGRLRPGLQPDRGHPGRPEELFCHRRGDRAGRHQPVEMHIAGHRMADLRPSAAT